LLLFSNINRNLFQEGYEMRKHLRYKLFIILLMTALLLVGCSKSTSISDEEFIKLISSNNIEKVQAALKEGKNPNLRDNEQRSALWVATTTSIDMTKTLLSAGANINYPESQLLFSNAQVTSINDTLASIRKDKATSLEMLKFLVQSGADVNVRRNGKTPLFSAAVAGNVEAVKFLVEHGATVTVRDNDGKTILIDMAGVWGGDETYLSRKFEITNYLLSKGIELKAKDSQGKTALDYAVNGLALANNQKDEQKRLRDVRTQDEYIDFLKIKLDGY